MAAARVTYVVSRWGEPTQTFVRREAQALAETGCAVSAWSLQRPVAGHGADTDVTWLRPGSIVRGLLAAVLRQPVRVARTYAHVVRLSAPRNWLRQLAATTLGVAWTGIHPNPDGHRHVHFGWVAATAAWAASQLDGGPYSVTLHAFEIHTARLHDRFTAVPLRGAARVFTVVDGDRDLVADRWGVTVESTRMGVPRSWLSDGVGALRDADLVVSVGSLVEKKGHAVLLDALSTTALPWRCVIVGEGPLRAELERQIERLGLGGRVVLAGARSEGEVRSLLDRAAVFCLASVQAASGDRDGVPVALMEAMARGTATIGTAVGGIDELLGGGAGLVVPPGDAEALSRALDSLGDGPRRCDLGGNGRQRIEAAWLVEQSIGPVVELARR